MFSNINAFLPLFSVFFTILVAIGGFVAYRQGNGRTVTEVQDKVITALKAQNEAQETQIAACEKEITRLKRVVTTIQIALKRRGLQIEIDGDAITLIDNQDRRARTIQIRMDGDEEKDHVTIETDTKKET